MAEVFFISDTHFGHNNILKFLKQDGTPLRDFHNIHEMHEYMIEKWNSVVSPQDKIYHIGDVAFSDEGMEVLGCLNGKKRLVKGNHDLRKTKQYLRFFEEIYGARQIDRYWLTHVPMHPQSMDRAKLNIHGHLHNNLVLDKHMKPDWRYYNVSVERIDYTPVNFDEIKKYYGDNCWRKGK